MINIPKPKFAAPARRGATRSKAARRAAEQSKKNFLAKAARGGLSAVTAALAAPAINPEAREVNAKQVELQEAILSDGPVPDDLLTAPTLAARAGEA